MFQSTASNILPIYKSELTEQSKSSNYNWKTLTKAGLVFVTTTGAFLALKATGSFSSVSSWLKNKGTNFDEQKTNLAVLEGNERIDLGLTGFEPPEALRTDSLLQLMNSKKSLEVKDLQRTAFMPQKGKRGTTEILERIGPEFQVNTYMTSSQSHPSVTGLSDGKFVVTWSSDGQDGSGYGVYGQMFNANGTKFLTEFQVNTYKTDAQDYSSIAKLSGGKFVVTWRSYGQDGNGYGVYGQMYNADSSKYFSEFRVNTYAVNSQKYPLVTELSDGKFVVAWTSDGQDGDSGGVYGQMYNADGSKYLSEFQVNTYTKSFQWAYSVVGLSDGKFVVTWYSYGQDGHSTGIYGQMFNADGSKFLSEFQVNTYTTDDQMRPSVAGLNDGKFVITWESYQDGSWDIYSQMYSANGTKFLSEFQVNTYTVDYQCCSSVAGLSDGKFVVTWSSDGQDGNYTGVYGQIFNANGSKYLSEFQVNTYTVNYQKRSSVVGLSDGKFVVTWDSDGQDGASTGIYGQMFVANKTFISSHISSSQQIPESSSISSNFASTSTKTSSTAKSISSIETLSSLSDQSVSSAKKSFDVKSGSSSKSFGSSSDVTSQTSTSVAKSSPTSIIESQSPSEQSNPTSTQETSSLSNTKEESSNSILVTSSQSQKLSQSETEGTGSIGIIIGAIIGGVSVVLCIAGGGIGYLLYRRNKHEEYERELCDIVSDESEGPSPKAKKAVSAKKKSQEDVQGESIKSEGGIFGVRDIQRIQQNDLNFEGDLGDGSFGRVYKATWQGSEVAVKVLKEGIAELPEFMGDFIREAATWSKLTHPNITRFFGICWTKPSPYIVVEYVGGGSLASHLKKKDLTLVQRLGLGLDTVRGVRYLHECDPPIWHRDIKPDNVLVEYTWNQTNEQWLPRGKVTDFGTARQKILNRTEKALTKGVGTPIYQAPEIITGSRDYSEKADIYSIGICLHEIYTQKEPYSDQPELFKSPLTFFEGIAKKGMRPTILEEMPKNYAVLIKQCWAERSSKRPNAAGVEQQLKPIVDEIAQECSMK